jgi:hypothetical protein
MSSSNFTVSVLDADEFDSLEAKLQSKRDAAAKNGYEIWQRYDNSVRDVMRRHSKAVGWDADVDFYHGGDWFHELYDGFALKTPTALSRELLHDLQKVVAKHHPDAVLDFGGDMDTPMLGFRVLVTANGVFVRWFESTAAVCRRNARVAGMEIL